jgi:hypothetical protein
MFLNFQSVLYDRCLKSLGATDEPDKVEFKLKRKYFILMGRKA